eukprot:1238392-Prymnesium_polylepis.1
MTALANKLTSEPECARAHSTPCVPHTTGDSVSAPQAHAPDVSMRLCVPLAPRVGGRCGAPYVQGPNPTEEHARP